MLTSVGTVLAAGDNSDGQCGQGDMKTVKKSGKQQEEVEECTVKSTNTFTPINHTGPPVIKVQ